MLDASILRKALITRPANGCATHFVVVLFSWHGVVLACMNRIPLVRKRRFRKETIGGAGYDWVTFCQII
jgi:hypothetical protein